MSIVSKPDTVPCECGGVAERIINWDGNTIVKGSERPYKLDWTSVPVNWEHGNVDPNAQQRRYERHIAEKRKLAVQNDKKAIKGGIRQIASIPRELWRMRTNQYGKDYFSASTQSTAELKTKLKADGLLFKD